MCIRLANIISELYLHCTHIHIHARARMHTHLIAKLTVLYQYSILKTAIYKIILIYYDENV